jgi:hypothetical protein
VKSPQRLKVSAPSGCQRPIYRGNPRAQAEDGIHTPLCLISAKECA